MPAARRLVDTGAIEEAARVVEGDLGVARLDQLQAAAAEARALLEATADVIGEPARRRTGFSAEGIAWQLAVAAAVQARVTHRCPHVREFGASATPIVTSLTHGVQVCDACMRRGVEWPAAIEEDHCDVCGRPTRIFCEAAVQMGPEFVLGNVWQTCAWFADRAIGEAAA